jgi:hypothetical protein
MRRACHESSSGDALFTESPVQLVELLADVINLGLKGAVIVIEAVELFFE